MAILSGSQSSVIQACIVQVPMKILKHYTGELKLIQF